MFEALQNAAALRSQLAAEKAANDRLTDLMERSVMEFDRMEPASVCSFPTTSILEGADATVMPGKSGWFAPALNDSRRSDGHSPERGDRTLGSDLTSCLPDDLRAKVDSILNQRSLSDRLCEFDQQMDNERRAADLFELRLTQMMNEPAPTLLERSDLNVLGHLFD